MAVVSWARQVSVATPDVDVTPVTFDVLGVEALDELIPEWDACATAGANGFRLSPWFAGALMVNSTQRQSFVITGRDAPGELQTVLPVWSTRPRFLGLRTLQPVALHAQEVSSVVVGAAPAFDATRRTVAFLLGPHAPEHDVLLFDTIDPTSPLFAALIEQAAVLDLPTVVGTLVPNPVIRPAADATLTGLSSRFQRNLRRAARIARDAGVAFECREISWDWHTHRAAVADLYTRRFGTEKTAHALHDAEVQATLGVLLGRLDRYFRASAFGAFVDGALAAYVVCFRGGNEVVLWASAHDSRLAHLSPGMLLWDYCLRDMATWPGVERINFGKGAERFKLDWSDGAYTVCSLAIVRATGWKRRRALARYERLAQGASVDDLLAD